MEKVFSILAILTCTQLFSQDSTNGVFNISGYAEAYYQYDFNKPANNNRPGFVYSHNRQNEFNINLGFLKVNYTANKVRANLALATGTYVNANLAAEPGVLKNIYEGNVGVKLSKQKSLWLDAGIFSSHIGFESATSKDCRTLTRSIAADNSPYYEAGAKITYIPDNGKWLFSSMALNGWQRIKRLDGNSMMSWGTQIQLIPSGNVLFNYSTFIGTDKPDSARLIRIFHNFYGMFSLTDKLALTLGFDIGTEEKSPTVTGTNTWFSPVSILKYTVNQKWTLAGRVEYYNDEHGVIINTATPNGFQTMGYSLNIDHVPAKNVLLRLEVKSFRSKDDIFVRQTMHVNNNAFLVGSLAVSF